MKSRLGALFLLCALACGSSAAATTNGDSALAKWLPKIGQGFQPQHDGQAAWSVTYDFFTCGRAPAAAQTPFANFSYAGRGCPALQNGSLFVYGAPEPTKGRVLNDRARTIVLYQEGCCYGRAAAHAVPGEGGISMLSYTTMDGNPSDQKNACGQFQNFAFRNGRLAYIELLAGC